MNAVTDPLVVRFQLAREIALEAGRHTLSYFQQDNFQIERKGDDSPVTIADRQAEQLLRKRISAEFPDDSILGEEFGETAGTSGYRWILDPIDGTKSFIHGVPLYTTLVGVEQDQRSVAGVIYAPATDELIAGAKGQGAWYTRQQGSPERAEVSKVDSLSAALFLTSEVANFRTARTEDATEVYLTLQNSCRLARTWGDAYGYMMVAIGRADVMIDPEMSVWDAAALQPIMEESGGTFTDWRGEPTIYGHEGIATNGRLLEAVLSTTRNAPPPLARSSET